jgi:hypothetical protein
MNTKTLETLPSNAKQALSTPNEIDLGTIVQTVASRKSKDGITFAGKKGKASLFSGVCATYRSARGLPRLNEDGTPARLPESMVTEVNEAIARFWEAKGNEIVNYGVVTSFRKDVSACKVNDKGEAELFLTATMKAKRECGDISELHRTAKLQLDKAEKRMDYMLDNAGKFERDDFETIRVKIMALKKVLGITE